jgi:Tat protein secretion system quality control protein TatD with DNase activity
MQFLSIHEFGKAPQIAISKLTGDGKAVLTDHGKPAAIVITVDKESFERVFKLVKDIETCPSATRIHPPTISDEERAEAFERLMTFQRKKAPSRFNYKKELMEAIDERFGSVD